MYCTVNDKGIAIKTQNEREVIILSATHHAVGKVRFSSPLITGRHGALRTSILQTNRNSQALHSICAKSADLAHN